MTSEGTETHTLDERSLASTLAPALIEASGGRLGEIGWFKADWQRGGAATGTGRWAGDDGTAQDVIIKLPVVTRELLWLERLQNGAETDPVVPRLFASGRSLGDYDLRWVVMERFPAGPLGLKWHDDHVPRLAEAAARFHHCAARFEVDQPPKHEPWDMLLDEAVENVRVNGVADEPRWINGLKNLRSRAKDLVAEWESRDVRQWLHGDLHLANALSRDSIECGQVGLIDLAEVHAGHWIEDAVYLERQLWARPERMKKFKPVKEIALARRRLGLAVEAEYPRLAMIRRGLLAGTAPRFLRSEGHPLHLSACLEWLERSLAELK